jgi:hypothetical protein
MIPSPMQWYGWEVMVSQGGLGLLWYTCIRFLPYAVDHGAQ